MLSIEHLSVEVGDRTVLHDLSLDIPAGETHALLGPNGAGKTTLLHTLMGFPRYRVVEGRIRLAGQDITGLPVDERARLGIGLAFQRPPVVRGVKVRDLAEVCRETGGDGGAVFPLAEELNVVGLLGRDANAGFSGGETKRTELLQLLAQHPRFAMLDEPESGVDLDNIGLLGRAIARLLGKGERPPQHKVSGLIITHTGRILQYFHADRGHVLMDGRLVCSGNPLDLFEHIEEHGYAGCLECAVCLTHSTGQP